MSFWADDPDPIYIYTYFRKQNKHQLISNLDPKVIFFNPKPSEMYFIKVGNDINFSFFFP